MPDRAQPPRMAFFAPTKAWGGIERAIANLANEMVARGLSVDILLTRGGHTPYPEALDPAVNVIDLKNRHKATALPRLLQYLRRHRPSALMTAKYHGAIVALWANRLLTRPVPLYLTIQNTLSITLPRADRQRRVRHTYPRADRLIAVSQGVADDLVTQFGIDRARIATIHNPVASRHAEDRLHQPIDHPWLNEAVGRAPVIISAGRLARQKDYPTLLRAFAELRRDREARLLILGEGPQREELEQLARSLHITKALDMPGRVEDPLPYMARGELFALSSVHEGLGNVLAEALVAGVPVVSTDCPSGPSEILQQGRLGPLTPPGDPKALARAMAQTLDQPPSSATLREGAEPFYVEHAVDQYLQTMGLAAYATSSRDNQTPTGKHQ